MEQMSEAEFESQLCLMLGTCLSLACPPQLPCLLDGHMHHSGLGGLALAVTHPALPLSLAGRWSVEWQLSKGLTWTSVTDCWRCVLRTETSSLPSLRVGDCWGFRRGHGEVGA